MSESTGDTGAGGRRKRIRPWAWIGIVAASIVVVLVVIVVLANRGGRGGHGPGHRPPSGTNRHSLADTSGWTR
jgi:hypothetical protein